MPRQQPADDACCQQGCQLPSRATAEQPEGPPGEQDTPAERTCPHGRLTALLSAAVSAWSGAPLPWVHGLPSRTRTGCPCLTNSSSFDSFCSSLLLAPIHQMPAVQRASKPCAPVEGNDCFCLFGALPLPPAIRTSDGQVFRVLILPLQSNAPDVSEEK